MWQPDGWGWRARIGVLTPHLDIGPGAEFWTMAPEGVSIHSARVPFRIVEASGGVGTPPFRRRYSEVLFRQSPHRPAGLIPTAQPHFTGATGSSRRCSHSSRHPMAAANNPSIPTPKVRWPAMCYA